MALRVARGLFRVWLVLSVLWIGVVTCATAENSVLRSLPTDVQKDIEETRSNCRGLNYDGALAVTSGDDGLIQFLLGDRKAVLVDPIVLCGGCSKGASCDNRGMRLVRVYALTENAWRMVLSNESITGDIFVSYVPGSEELNALVANLFFGNKECPTRRAPDMSSQSRWARSCVVRWNGSKFTYKPL